MLLREITLAGYRAFAATQPGSEVPWQHVRLAPLTLIIGKNNSGKSTILNFVHHTLAALASRGADPWPMRYDNLTFGDNFRDVIHGGPDGKLTNPLNLSLEFHDGHPHKLEYELRLMEVDQPPKVTQTKINNIPTTPPTRGLLPETTTFDGLRTEAQMLLNNSQRLGPLREPVRQMYRAKGAEPGFGSTDQVAQLLFENPQLKSKVAEWMKDNLEKWNVEIEQTLDNFSLMVRKPGRKSNLANAGQGIQQLLPVVTLCQWRALKLGPFPFIDMIEQPELHLHDAAHAALGDLVAQAMDPTNGVIMVETHSESLLLRIRRRIAEGQLNNTDVHLIYVDDADGSSIKHIPIHPNGEVGWWPEGVFSEAFEEVKALRRAQRKATAAPALRHPQD